MQIKENYQSQSDENLLFLFSDRQDKVALDVLFNRHMASAYYLALKYTRNQADAEDVVQKAFINIMRFASNQNQSGKVKAWIMKTVINTCKNEIKASIIHRKHIRIKSSEKSVVVCDKNSDSEDLKKILYRAIENLPEQFRLPIWLTHYENMSIKEVSDCLGKPEKTIRTQILRGLEKLELSLKGQLSQINTINIAVLLAQFKLEQRLPVTLENKIRQISNMKIPNYKTLSISSKNSNALNWLIPFIIAIGFSFYWFTTYIKESRELSNIRVIKDSNDLSKKDNTVDNDTLDLHSDFNSPNLPNWCLLMRGDKQLSGNSKEGDSYLKSNSIDHFLLHLKIPQQKKPFIVSYDLKPSKGKDSFPRFYNLSAGNVKNTITFCYDVPLNLEQWNRVEIIVQDHIESMWFNGKLKMVVISEDKYGFAYQIGCADFFAKIDNLTIKRIEDIDTRDFSHFIELAKKLKNDKEPFSTILPSPIKHQFETVKVYSSRSESGIP